MASRSATTATEFSLDHLIEEVRDEVGPDPEDIARKVQGRIPPTAREAVELKLLVNYVRSSKPRLATIIQRSAREKPTANRSAKVIAFQRLARVLAAQVCVGPRQYKTLGDCTYDDLIYAAEKRREHASYVVAEAEGFERWAELVKENGAATVGAIRKPVLTAFVDSLADAA